MSFCLHVSVPKTIARRWFVALWATSFQQPPYNHKPSTLFTCTPYTNTIGGQRHEEERMSINNSIQSNCWAHNGWQRSDRQSTPSMGGHMNGGMYECTNVKLLLRRRRACSLCLERNVILHSLAKTNVERFVGPTDKIVNVWMQPKRYIRMRAHYKGPMVCELPARKRRTQTAKGNDCSPKCSDWKPQQCCVCVCYTCMHVCMAVCVCALERRQYRNG